MILKYLIIISIILSVAVACTGTPYKAPVVDASPIPSHRIRKHVVAPGETLYSIALRYDLDYKKLAKVNKLSFGYHISPGQTLSLDTRHVTLPATSPKVASAPISNTASSALNKSPVGRESSKKQTDPVSKATVATKSAAAFNWQWPVKGEVLEVFHADGGLNKGIDIRGKLGEPVLAAAEGEVVYSGTGLRGYGKLVIVKHNEQFLSAYAHNRVLVVAEGDKVKVGQKIAEVGFSGTNTAKLHFEIRLDGKPVNPLDYLPNP